MTVRRVLLLLPTATYRAPDFMRAASALGVEVVVGSERKQALAADMGDRAVVVPLDDPDAAVAAIASLHHRAPIDAVVAVDDQGVLIAARAGERLGLLHNPPDAAAATRDKAELRRRLGAAGVPQPAWALVGDAGWADVGFPCVLKPVSFSGSRGVIRADDPSQAEEAARRIRAIFDDAGVPADSPILVERFVSGPEVAVEGLLRGGELTVLAVFDKPDPLDGPFFEETLYVTPSRLAPAVLDAVAARTRQAASALGLREGPVHAELRVDGDDAVVIELAARTIGGLCARSLRFGLGVSLEELVLRHALNLPMADLTREQQASGVMMLPIPVTGTLEAVDGQADARAVDGIEGLQISIPIGQRVRALPEGDRYLGFLFARASTPDQAEQSLREAASRLRIQIAADPA
jgi:biotin carboxylase